MSRLEIRGIIAPSDYDMDYMQDYIKKGILTPESRFRAQLAEAKTDEPLDVYVNSPGGSVFAGNEMINAVRDWKKATGQKVNVIIGAMAASMASAFTIAVADSAQAHSNAKMMFHGAWTISIGGKELHQDTAELLGSINADIMGRLVSGYKIDPDVVAAWFAEGREGWLTAGQMKAYGIIKEILTDPADAIEFPPDAIADMETRGFGVAALLTENLKGAEDGSDDTGSEGDAAGAGEGAGEGDKSGDGDGDGSGDDADGAGDAGGNEGSGDGAEGGEGEGSGSEGGEGDAEGAGTEGGEGEGGGEEGDGAGVEDMTQSLIYLAGVEAGRLAATTEFAVFATKLKDAEAACRKLQGERDRIKTELDAAIKQHAAEIKDISDKLRDANEQLAKLLNGALEFSPTFTTWEEALASFKGDYSRAAKAYPALLAKYDQEHQRKK